MKTIRINPALPSQRWRTTLDGIRFGFRLEWRDRAASWYLSLYDASGEALIEGVRLVSGLPLLEQHVDPRLPGGRLMVLDMEGLDDDLERDAWEERFRLVYLEDGEIDAQAASGQTATVVTSGGGVIGGLAL